MRGVARHSTAERLSLPQVVDSQNADDAAYTPLAPAYEAGTAFQAALSLILDGRGAPNGYTEPTLHRYRQLVKGGLAEATATVAAEGSTQAKL